MTSTASSRYKAEKQGLGDNTNTWGDTRLNVVVETLDRGSKGYEAIAITGDTTLTWSNYSASNSGQVAVIRLTGSMTSAWNLIVPSVEWQWDAIINATGATVTVKTSAGTGVTIPTGYQASVYNNGSDCVGASPTRVFGDIYAGGQIKNVTAGTVNTDATNLLQVNNLIAAGGGTGAADGSVKVDAAAASVYLGAALTDSGALTITDNGDSLDLGVSYGALINGGDQTGNFNAAVNTEYTADTSGGDITMTCPSIATKRDKIKVDKYGTGTLTINWNGLKYLGSTSTVTTTAEGVLEIVYTNAARGWVGA